MARDCSWKEADEAREDDGDIESRRCLAPSLRLRSPKYLAMPWCCGRGREALKAAAAAPRTESIADIRDRQFRWMLSFNELETPLPYALTQGVGTVGGTAKFLEVRKEIHLVFL